MVLTHAQDLRHADAASQKCTTEMQSLGLTVLMSKTGRRLISHVFLILLQNLLTLELSAGRLSQIDGCSPSDGSAVM
jgi:hypothetical protein